MTNPFTAADVENMATAQEIHAYTDIAAYIPAADPNTTDSYGQPTASSDEITMMCAFVDTTKTERWRADAEIENIDAEVFFTGYTPTKGGSIKILKRFGRDVTNKTFEIIGIQDRGPFGFVCALKAVVV